MKCLVKVGLLVMMVSIFSCASTDDIRLTAPLVGMVYNMDRLPVADASVSLVENGRTIIAAMTDIRGHFALADVPFGHVTVRFTKDSYEPVAWTFDFREQSQVGYIKMENVDELLEAAATAVEKREWQNATAALARIEKLKPHFGPAAYLQAIMLTDQGKAADAAQLLEPFSSANDPSFPIELTLADLYQNKLGDRAKALIHLKLADAVKKDIYVEARIAALAGG